MAKPTLEQAVAVLVANGPALRHAGYTEIEVDGVRAVLAPRDPGPNMPDDAAKDEMPVDPLNDPSTFGYLPGSGSGVPGFRHRPGKDEA